MKLKELLKEIPVVDIIGSDEVEITGVNIDSRRIKEGHIFVAMKGTQVDGHKFIPKAIELGAKAVLCEDMPADKAEGVFKKVPDRDEFGADINESLIVELYSR
jgi:UDP-N-acetylmuramoyl-L-alanyl-D-glutamate--2,6-diaminopimelate ligase